MWFNDSVNHNTGNPMSKTIYVQVTLRLPLALYKRIERIAKAKTTSVNKAINALLEENSA